MAFKSRVTLSPEEPEAVALGSVDIGLEQVSSIEAGVSYERLERITDGVRCSPKIANSMKSGLK